MALSLSGDLAPDALRDVIEYRRDALAAQRSYLRTPRNTADPHLTPMERAIFGHLVTRVDADLRWHTDVLDTIDANPEP